MPSTIHRLPYLWSDRQVLLNWVPRLCREDPPAFLFRQIPPEHLDKSLWLEVYRKGGPPLDTMSYLARSLRNDPDIVKLQLLCTRGDGRLF
jgi:hypothetical protein